MHYIHILTHSLHGQIVEVKKFEHIKNKYKFPKVIGAIDGTHIEIAAPKLHPDAYINRKGYHSIQLQVFL